ncbi:unnamed protein product [Candidula unifasciata]|uniref:Uncharacterized protein n=1 Tax=Candidula unifasciata TaxID=100452 RepID=A0A8S3ZVG3_9EUPU|nr:unnamed protein product [Candidula unifasciata]
MEEVSSDEDIVDLEPTEKEIVCNTYIGMSTPPLSSTAPSSLSDNEDRTSQRSNGAASSRTSLPQEGEKIIKDDVKDSCAEEGEMASPKEPVDIMGEMELEPVSDEDSPLDNLSIDESSDGEKEEGEEKDSDKDDDKSSHKSSQVVKVETPSKISDVVTKDDDEASDEGEIKSDSDDSAKATEDKERMSGRKPIELVDFGEAEKRARGGRSFYPEAQPDRARPTRGIVVPSHPPVPYRGGYTAWPQTEYYSSGIRYSLSHEAVSSSRLRSPMAAVYDGGESETSSQSRSSVRLRDDVPPPYPIDGVKRKHRSPASDQGSSSLYKTLSAPSPVSSASSSRSRSSSSARSRSQSGSRSSSSSSSFSSSRSSQRKKRLKRKKRTKRRSTDTEKTSSLKSQTSTSKLSGPERIVSPVNFSEIPSLPIGIQSRERLLSSGHESISSDELPYFPDEEPPKPSPKATINKSPGKNSPSSSNISSKSAQSNRKKKRESISSSELIYSPSRLKSPAPSSATSKGDEDDNMSIECPPMSPGRSSISSDELPDYPVEDSDPAFLKQFSPHQPPLPSDLPPLPEDTDGFQPPLPQDSPPMFLDIQPPPPPPPPPPVDEDDSRIQPPEIEEGEISDSEKILVPPEFEEGEIEDTVDLDHSHISQRAFADPRVKFQPPLKHQDLLPNVLVVSPFSTQSSPADLQLPLKPWLPICTVAGVHPPDTHSQSWSSQKSTSPASQQYPSVQTCSKVAIQEHKLGLIESEGAHHTVISDCTHLQKGEKNTSVMDTSQSGTIVLSAEDFRGDNFELNSTSCSEAIGTKALNSKIDSLKTFKTITTESVISPVTDLNQEADGNKDETIMSDSVIVPVTNLQGTLRGNEEVEMIISDCIIEPVTDLHHKVEESEDVKTVISDTLIVTDLQQRVEEKKDVEMIILDNDIEPVTDLHHKAEGSEDVKTVISDTLIVTDLQQRVEEKKDVEMIISDNDIEPVTDLHHKVEGSEDVKTVISDTLIVTDLQHRVEEKKDVEMIISDNDIEPVTDLHPKAEGSEDVKTVILDNDIELVTDLPHKVERNRDYESVILENVIVPASDFHHRVDGSKDVESLMSEDVIVDATDLHTRVEGSKDVQTVISEHIVSKTDLHQKVKESKAIKKIISEDVLEPVTDLHHVVEGSNIIVNSLDASLEKTQITGSALPISDFEEKIENNKTIRHSGSEIETKGIEYSGLQTSEDLMITVSKSLSLKINKAVDNGKSLDGPDQQCEDQNKPQFKSHSIPSSEAGMVSSNLAVKIKGLENDVSKLCSGTKLEGMTNPVLQSRADTTNIKGKTDAVLQSNSDKTVIEDIQDSVLSNSGLNINERNVAVLQSISDRKIEDMKDGISQSQPELTVRPNESLSPQETSETSIKDNESIVPPSSSEVSMDGLHVLTPLSESEVKNKDIDRVVTQSYLEFRDEDFQKSVSQSISEVESDISVLVQSSVCVEMENTKSAIISQPGSCLTLVDNERLSDSACVSEEHPVNAAETIDTSKQPSLSTTKIVETSKQSLLIIVEQSTHVLEVMSHAVAEGKSEVSSEPSLLCEEVVIRPEGDKDGSAPMSSELSLVYEEIVSRTEDHEDGSAPISSELSVVYEEVASRPELKEHLVSTLSLESTIVPEKSIQPQTISSLQGGHSEEYSLDSSILIKPDIKSSLLAQPLTINTESVHLNTGQSVQSHTLKFISSKISSCDKMYSSKDTSAVTDKSNSVPPSEFSVAPSTADSHKVEDSSLRPECGAVSSTVLVSDQTLNNTEIKPVHVMHDSIQENSSAITSPLPGRNFTEETEQFSGFQSVAQSSSSEIVSDQTLISTYVKPLHIAKDAIQEKHASATSPFPKNNVLEGIEQSSSQNTTQSLSSELTSDQTLKSLHANIVHIICDNIQETSEKSAGEPTGSDTETKQSVLLSEEPTSLSESSQANNSAIKDQNSSTPSSAPLKTDMLATSHSERATMATLEPKLEQSKESVYSPQASALPSPGQRSVSSEETYETPAACSKTRSKRRMPEDSGNSSDTSAASNESFPKRRRRGIAGESDKLVVTPASAPTSRPGTRLQIQQQQELAKPQTRGRSNSLPSNRAAKRKQDNDESPPTRKQKR